MAHRLIYWEDKEKTFEESKKSSSRVEFSKKSYGAYRVAKKNGWLGEMVWLNKKNVYKHPVDVVYKYHFKNENVVYVGRTIYPELRDKQHRTRENDTVYRFAKENNIEIPQMEILEDGLTVLQGAKRETYDLQRVNLGKISVDRANYPRRKLRHRCGLVRQNWN